MYKGKIRAHSALWSAATVFFGVVASWACVYVVAGFLDRESGQRIQVSQGAAVPVAITELQKDRHSRRRKLPKPERLASAEIKNYLNNYPLNLTPGETLVDGVRRFITENSVHKIDDVHQSYGGDMALMMRKILRHAQGRGSPPHLECSTRSGAMLEVLEAYGIRSRHTFLFTDAQERLKSHTLLEVWNESSGRWELQDPDYAIYYIDRATGQRVGAERIVKEPIDQFVPCRGPGDCSWNHARKLRDFFDVFAYEQQGFENLTVTINSSRFELDKIFDHPSGRHDLETYIRREWSKQPPKIQIIQ